MSRFLVISEGERPATAEPLFATGDRRLVSVALDAVFGDLLARAEVAPRADEAADRVAAGGER